MNSQSIKVLYIKGLFVAILGIAIFTFSLLTNFPIISPVNAQSSNLTPAGPDERAAVLKALQSPNNSCPEPFKKRYEELIQNPDAEVYLKGTLVVAYDDSNQPIALTCANASSFQKIIIRSIMIIFALVGIVLTYAIGRAAILMITSFTNAEQFETGVKSLISSVLYTVGVLFFYTIFVFVAVDVVGIGKSTTRPEYNLFCSNRIIFNLTFDNNAQC